jgi:hypothetical protein
MFDDDGWPDVQGVPWQLLIRVKYTYQVDVLVAAVTQRAVAPRLPEGLGQAFTKATTSIAARTVTVGRVEQRKFSSEQLGGLARALDDFMGWCGTPWPHHLPKQGPGPDPDPHPWREGGLAEVALIIDAANRLVQEVGSSDLRRSLGPALDDVLGALQEKITIA